jgi:hypothetical protein
MNATRATIVLLVPFQRLEFNVQKEHIVPRVLRCTSIAPSEPIKTTWVNLLLLLAYLVLNITTVHTEE